MRTEGERLGRFSYRPHPHLYEINTYVWLQKLSAKLGHVVVLGDVPDDEWDRLRELGFDFVYLMGVWRRSQMGCRLFRTDTRNFYEFDASLPGWKMADVIGSPFSIQNYDPDPRVGAKDGLREVHHKLRARGMGLILDFVPNHTGFDHPWVQEHPEWYIQGTEKEFRRDPAAFYLLEKDDGQNLFIARGKDPNFSPWCDVAQLNYFNPECRRAMIGVLKTIAEYCDGVRCDMAMLVTNEVFSRTWGNLLHSWPTPSTEFWQDAITEVPDFVWLAEVYWDLEWRMQQLGFQFTYDKRLYDCLRQGSPRELRAHLSAEISYQSKLARFLENHDEPRSAAVFPRETIGSLAILLSTLPGMRFYYEGQLEGAKNRVLMPLARAPDEPVDLETYELYEQALRFADHDVCHAGQWQLLEVRAAGDDTFLDLVAYQWCQPGSHRLVVVNLGDRTAQGRVCNAEVGISNNCLYSDCLDGNRYVRDRAELVRDGLYVRLAPHRAHAFAVEEA